MKLSLFGCLENGTHAEGINVRCEPFSKILERFGIPYYLKIDIEGGEDFCIQGLEKMESRPSYISWEATYPRFGTASLFVPEELPIVARQFIAGSIQRAERVPEGRLKSGRLSDPNQEPVEDDMRSPTS